MSQKVKKEVVDLWTSLHESINADGVSIQLKILL